MSNKNLIDTNELADLLKHLDVSEITQPEMSEEMKASQRRYEEIIKKHEADKKQQ